MSTIERRVSALEQASPGERDTVTITRFQNPSELSRELFNLEGDYGVNPRRHWERAPSESEKTCTDRASKEVKRNEYGIAMLFSTTNYSTPVKTLLQKLDLPNQPL
jgi:hypothetical protein